MVPIQLNYRDSRPIYEQVRDGLRKLIVAGVMAPGDRLPSVRQMATSLAINPNTIQRAYEALEHEGYSYSVSGKGSFVAGREQMDARRREELLKELDELVQELEYLGVSREQMMKRFLSKDAVSSKESKDSEMLRAQDRLKDPGASQPEGTQTPLEQSEQFTQPAQNAKRAQRGKDNPHD